MSTVEMYSGHIDLSSEDTINMLGAEAAIYAIGLIDPNLDSDPKKDMACRVEVQVAGISFLSTYLSRWEIHGFDFKTPLLVELRDTFVVQVRDARNHPDGTHPVVRLYLNYKVPDEEVSADMKKAFARIVRDGEPKVACS